MPKKNIYLKHETKRHALLRFMLLILVLIVYLFWMIHRFGSKSGLEITALTWSFFIFCTPIADAGFLLAFPIRIIMGIRMLTSQIYVFSVAFFLDFYFFFFHKELFSETFLLKIFQKIIEKPFPYWSIIILSIIGTFISIYFGDELFDTIRHDQRVKYKKHRLKHRFVIAIFLFTATFLIYRMLIKDLGIKIF